MTGVLYTSCDSGRLCHVTVGVSIRLHQLHVVHVPVYFDRTDGFRQLPSAWDPIGVTGSVCFVDNFSVNMILIYSSVQRSDSRDARDLPSCGTVKVAG